MKTRADNFHSQLVGWTKIILPICGIAIFSTLFLFVRDDDGGVDIPMAELQTLAREQKISAPQFSGVTDNGSIITVGAKSAKPDTFDPNIMRAVDLALTVETADGNRLSITATDGEVDATAKRASLDGLTRLETSGGYSMETNGLSASLDTGIVTSDGALEVRAPYGALTAGRVTFATNPADGGQQILFTDGVKLVYTPDKADTKDTTE